MIGPYLFENVGGNALIIDGVRDREMLANFLWSKLDGIDVKDIFFQQDGPTCHTACHTMELLKTGQAVLFHLAINIGHQDLYISRLIGTIILYVEIKMFP